MNISLEELLEIFVEAQGMKRQKGLRTRDYIALVNVQIRRCDHPERRSAIKRKDDRRKKEKAEVAEMRKNYPKWNPPKRPFDDGSETEWERTRRYCG